MALQLQGNAGIIAEVDSNTRAVRVSARPTDVGALGSYALVASTGTMAAGLAAGSPIFSFRWGSANVALIRTIRVALTSLGTGFTVGVGYFDLVAARGFTASDSAGTAISLATNNNKRRTSFGASLVTDMRISSTATLTAGTRTLDGNALAGVRFGITAALNTVMQPTTAIWAPDFSGEWPLVLALNEGFIIRATVPATGVWQADVSIEWTELTSF